LKAAVRTAKGRTLSSTRWLQRQLNDPYVIEAAKRGFRSRSAFKLIQLDDKYHFLKPGARVVDLGAAPGGWTQVAVQRVKSTAKGPKRGHVVAIDILPMKPVEGAAILEHDFLAEDAPDLIRAALAGPADVVMSDMAANATGHAPTDHLRIVALCEAALEFARSVLVPGGTFVAKVFQGGAQGELMALLKQDFGTVRHAKPPASRRDSAEFYVVAQDFRGAKA
jgi:23S rRNA (uridine2552-2'-O)-methyltransferase